MEKVNDSWRTYLIISGQQQAIGWLNRMESRREYCITFALLCADCVFGKIDTWSRRRWGDMRYEWEIWKTNWLDGTDRSEDSADRMRVILARMSRLAGSQAITTGGRGNIVASKEIAAALWAVRSVLAKDKFHIMSSVEASVRLAVEAAVQNDDQIYMDLIARAVSRSGATYEVDK